MNYSTIKTAVACSLVAAFGLTETANAQEPTVFGGRSQYRTWTLGVQAGGNLPFLVTGGNNAFNQKVQVFDQKLGVSYGLFIRKQFSHHFGLELEGNRGQIRAYNHEDSGPAAENSLGAQSVETDINWAGSLNGVFQFGTIDFLRRENSVNFYAKAGIGVLAYNPVQYSNNEFGGTVVFDQSGTWGDGVYGEVDEGTNDNRGSFFVPVGVGVKFKLSDRISLNLGYNLNFVDDNLLYGPSRQGDRKNHYSNINAGLEFSLGSSSKANLTWHNPVATLYDELKDPSLRNELEALKQRVSTLEGLVDELSRDEDGDGVSDKFDKCPGTPAGTQVDGAGCPIKFPEPEVKSEISSYSNIQFEFDSSVLKTESYSTLDKLSAELRESGATVTLDGHASAEGSEAYNLNLSRDRANSVKQYLVNSGVDAAKINVQAFGESAPIASNATEEGRVLNRRVEIKK